MGELDVDQCSVMLVTELSAGRLLHGTAMDSASGLLQQVVWVKTLRTPLLQAATNCL